MVSSTPLASTCVTSPPALQAARNAQSQSLGWRGSVFTGIKGVPWI
jgi:hypothetical protein